MYSEALRFGEMKVVIRINDHQEAYRANKQDKKKTPLQQ